MAVEALTAVLDLKVLTGPDVVDVLLPNVLTNINAVGSTDEVSVLPTPRFQQSTLVAYARGFA